MGINNVIEVMIGLDKAKPGSFYTTEEIKRELETKGLSNGSVKKTYSHLLKLSMFSMVEMRGKGLVHHIKEFRLHKGRKPHE